MHTSVLLKESLASLNLHKTSIVIDCTLGYGGHSSEILKQITAGYLYALDQDQEAIDYSMKRLAMVANNYEIIKTNFKNVKLEMDKRQVKADAILFDLGVSSPQLDEANRGFSFHQKGRLDMRMDQSQALSAYEVVNQYDYESLVRILRDYGEEAYATSIAKGIIASRPITTTLDLVTVIQNHVPYSYRRLKHPARKTFQAIRIEVNDELNVLAIALTDALSLLKVGGRLAVITFEPLEDKLCKHIFKAACEVNDTLKKLPIIPVAYQPKYQLVTTIYPTELEIKQNNRSRSAKLRVIERIKE